MTIKDELKKLGSLYEATKVDWIININHVLTEPTCPTVTIYPEGYEISRYRHDCDTMEEGITRAVEHVYREVIGKEILGSAAPFSNPDDAAFEKWLKERGEFPQPKRWHGEKL